VQYGTRVRASPLRTHLEARVSLKEHAAPQSLLHTSSTRPRGHLLLVSRIHVIHVVIWHVATYCSSAGGVSRKPLVSDGSSGGHVVIWHVATYCSSAGGVSRKPLVSDGSSGGSLLFAHAHARIAW